MNDDMVRFSWAVLLFAAVLSGCSRTPEQAFNSATEVSELPERHQQNIEDGLRRLFGTPLHPRVRVADPDAEEASDEDEADASDADAASDEAQVVAVEYGGDVALSDIADLDHLAYGAKVYTARCAGCHGAAGDGNGAAAAHLVPKPRDYRPGVFKFTSTPYGSKPARHDLVRTIRRGAKGTSMPAFPWMTDEDLDAVIDYVIYLSKRGEVERFVAMISPDYAEDEDIEFVEFLDGIEAVNERWAEAEQSVVLPVTAEPEFSEETVVAGRKLFLSQGCSKCHGEGAKGQTAWLNPDFIAKQESLPDDQRETINYDVWKNPAPAADITARLLHGGRRPIDIYRRVYTGINGTPMPAFGSVFAEQPESFWHLVHYVRHIIEGGDPTVGIDAADVQPETTPAEEA